MLEHLRGRDLALEPLGWTGREAEWIALVCLHSGVFTRAQFCHYFDTDRKQALRFVKTLLDRKTAVESESPVVNGGGKTCRIMNKAIYRALGVENIKHRRPAARRVLIRRLLSLDYVIEHPGLNWLPKEHEKVQFLIDLGLPRSLVPRRIYYGALSQRKRYFALKLPLALDPEAATFVYIDPGLTSDAELRSWGAAHARLWEALRKAGRRVRVIGIAAEDELIERAERVLKMWSATIPIEYSQGRTLQQEIQRIGMALSTGDQKVLAEHGGFNAALRKGADLESLPEARVTEGVSIDEFSTYRAIRFSAKNGGA